MFIAAVAAVVITLLLWKLAGVVQRKKLPTDPLDRILFYWAPGEPMTVRALLNGGVSIIGRAGSGKTSSVGKLLGWAIVRYLKSGGLIIAPKSGEDLALWRRIFHLAGRENDLIVFSPEMPNRFNFIAYILASGGTPRDITKFFTVVGETLRSGDTKAGENSDFWQRETERMIYNAVVILKLAFGNSITAPLIQQFISGAAMSLAEINTPEWQKGVHRDAIQKAINAKGTTIDEADLVLSLEYWLREVPTSDQRTRSNILTGVMGIMHCMNTGLVRELVSGQTNCSPDDMLVGKWILVDMSQAEYGDTAAAICGGWKYLTQKRVQRRVAKEGDYINVIWCDEAQQSLTSFDHYHLAVCRSKMGCQVFLSQSLASYYSALHGESGKHQVNSLLANFHTKVFLALGDVETANYAANLIGKSLQTFVGTSSPPIENIWEEFMGFSSKITTSTSCHYEMQVQSAVFQNGLRCGGPENNFVCDGIVIRSGEPFISTGQNYLFVPFSQKE